MPKVMQTYLYVEAMHTYKKRKMRLKQQMMKKYNWNGHSGGKSKMTTPEEFKKRNALLRRRIEHFRSQHKKIKAKDLHVAKIGRITTEFFGCGIRYFEAKGTYRGGTGTKEQIAARQFFAKYLLESGYHDKRIVTYLNGMNSNKKTRTSHMRDAVHQKFAKDPTLRTTYRNYVQYIKEEFEK